MQRVQQARTVGGLSCVPYLAGFTNCVLWLKYGMMLSESTIMTVNTVGAGLNAYYIFVYYSFSAERVRRPWEAPGGQLLMRGAGGGWRLVPPRRLR